MIITLCGSSRFEKHFKVWNQALSLAGHSVFSISCYASDKPDGYSAEEKLILDKVHIDKIRMSDAVVLLNVFAYIGESTMREVKHAQSVGVPVFPLESWGKGLGICYMHTDEVRARMASYDIKPDYRSPVDTSKRPFKTTALFSDLLGAGYSPLRSKLVALVESANQLKD